MSDYGSRAPAHATSPRRHLVELVAILLDGDGAVHHSACRSARVGENVEAPLQVVGFDRLEELPGVVGWWDGRRKG